MRSEGLDPISPDEPASREPDSPPDPGAWDRRLLVLALRETLAECEPPDLIRPILSTVRDLLRRN